MTREWGQGNDVEDLLLVPRSGIERSEPRHRMHDRMLPGDNTGVSRLPIGPFVNMGIRSEERRVGKECRL